MRWMIRGAGAGGGLRPRRRGQGRRRRAAPRGGRRRGLEFGVVVALLLVVVLLGRREQGDEGVDLRLGRGRDEAEALDDAVAEFGDEAEDRVAEFALLDLGLDGPLALAVLVGEGLVELLAEVEVLEVADLDLRRRALRATAATPVNAADPGRATFFWRSLFSASRRLILASSSVWWGVSPLLAMRLSSWPMRPNASATCSMS